ncbi:LysE/ArgO family amino acid transporter [Arthrobacter sulfonylureivorans]|uniref:LysE/ArgO family amino acid transporter n=1 Tax=Arthrobacter sulfonylureivorans TaxID=2486855 RepID=A0ABY3WE71_9MICC|nr:LysE/ArgO family amino acid transporter [Arthrobacter sulfonylureivorans]UNK47493.1 LysE/ArgO family amino acid transporter [Arthrobacter sulfonylureivorans]
MAPTVLLGLGTGLALIIAIGAQNAFVLRQGIRGEHIGVVVLICAVSDAVLIAAGIAGIGAVIEAAPAVVDVIRLGGAAFLLAYAVFAAKRAIKPGALTAAENQRGGSLASVAATAFALTWLNPHVYLDTVLLLGSIANTQGPDLRWYFGAGAVLGSIAWFGALGFGARLLRPIFARPGSWRILDGLIAVVMLALGLRMAFGF